MKQKKSYIMLILLAYISGTKLKAIHPELIDMQQVGTTAVYTYKVSGEDIQEPKKISHLYGYIDMPYALCSKALCTIDKNNPGKAICICPIYGLYADETWQKASVGPKDLAQTAPTMRNGQLETVVSNYSMANIKNRKKIPQTTCSAKEPLPWANCYGVRCSVRLHPLTGKPEAICECPLVITKKFVSIGPEGKRDCQKGSDYAWSAATKKQAKNNNVIMTEIYKKLRQ